MPEPKGKILGIGLQRTGTTSLYHALLQLGVNAAPHSIPLYYNIEDKILSEYDAFMDNPIPLIYQKIDSQLSNCKFILTTRDLSDWLKSVQWLFEQELPCLSKELQKVGNEIHQEFYGTTCFSKSIFEKRWQEYHQEVSSYFQSRKDDLLIIDFKQPGVWERLCNFLKLPVPNAGFPHLNKRRKFF